MSAVNEDVVLSKTKAQPIQEEPRAKASGAPEPISGGVEHIEESAPPIGGGIEQLDETPDPISGGAEQGDDPESDRSSPAEDDEPQKATVSLRLQFRDFGGRPIEGLVVRLEAGSTGMTAVTNGLGFVPTLDGLVPDTPWKVEVQKEDGSWVTKHEARVLHGDMEICGFSPSIKVPITTELHEGPKGPEQQPAVKPPPVEVKPNPPPKGTPLGGGKAPPCTTPEPRRDANGHPVARLKEYAADWAGRIGIPTLGLWQWSDFKAKSGPTHPLTCAPAPNAAQAKPATAAPAASAPKVAPATPQPRSAALLPVKLAVTNVDQKPPKELVHLLEIMEEQVGWNWEMAPLSSPSAVILAELAGSSLGTPETKARSKSSRRCYKSVKVGLKRANYVAGVNEDIPASTAGPWLLGQGFREVTAELPDARWAWPGDVIVYCYPKAKAEKNDATEKLKYDKALERYHTDQAKYEGDLKRYEAARSEYEVSRKAWVAAEPKKPFARKFTQKAPKPPVQPKLQNVNYGHIDVRSYDAYLSDFSTGRLQSALDQQVIGIYRKISDPLPEIRVKAFLWILREWECPDARSDAARYSMKFGGKLFDGFSKHPFDGVKAENTPAGAYQITLGTFNGLQGERYGLPKNFEPSTQDRMAVILLEEDGALGPIRSGDVAAGATRLKGRWSSLPGGVHARKKREGNKVIGTYDMDDLKKRFDELMAQLVAR